MPRRTSVLVFQVCSKACGDLWKDITFTQAAAISYYLIVSFFPLLLFLIGIAGFFVEPEDTQRHVLSLVGQSAFGGNLEGPARSGLTRGPEAGLPAPSQ
jgi:uncharacterized BrkB/YihY/UPF0761 family membrane protein